jgi:hypothetical protein
MSQFAQAILQYKIIFYQIVWLEAAHENVQDTNFLVTVYEPG